MHNRRILLRTAIRLGPNTLPSVPMVLKRAIPPTAAGPRKNVGSRQMPPSQQADLLAQRLIVRRRVDGATCDREFAAIRQSDVEKLSTVRSRSQRVHDNAHLVTWLDAVRFPAVFHGLAG